MVITLSLEINLPNDLHVKHMTAIFFPFVWRETVSSGPLYPISKVLHLLSYRYLLSIVSLFKLLHLVVLLPKIWKWSNWMFIYVLFRNKWNQRISKNQNVWTSPLLWPSNATSSYDPRICSPWWESFISQHRGIAKMIL